MTIKRHRQNNRLSEISQSDKLFISSGQVADGEGIEEQTKSILKNLDNLLAEVGLSKSNILYANIFLINIDDYTSFNKIWDNWVDAGQRPSRSAIQVVRLANPEWLVEVQIFATA